MADCNQPKKSKIKSFFKYLFYLFSTLVVALTAFNLYWAASGSNEWGLEYEKNGVQVFSRNTPGGYVKQFKASMNTDFSLDHLVAGLIENADKNICDNYIPSCMDVQVISPWNEKLMSDTVLWKLELPPPFLPRETIIRSHVVQDQETGAVIVDIYSAPNAIPRNPGAFRVTHMQNRWIYTPLKNGQTEVTFIQDIDMGGMFPDFLLNLAGAEETYKFLYEQLPQILDRDELRSIDYSYIKSLEELKI